MSDMVKGVHQAVGDDAPGILEPTEPFLHEPEVPPRDGMIGEQVFAASWKRRMKALYDVWGHGDEIDRLNPHFRGVLGHFPYEISQADATIAASMVKWLGTNVGRCFIETAMKDPSEEGVLKAWAVENVSKPWLSYGRTPIDNILMTAGDIEANSRRGLLTAVFTSIPDRKSVRAIGVCNHIALWLGSGEGRRFVRRCLAAADRKADMLRTEQSEARRQELALKHQAAQAA